MRLDVLESWHLTGKRVNRAFDDGKLIWRFTLKRELQT